MTHFPAFLARWGARSPFSALGLGLALTCLCAWLALGLGLKNDFMDLLPQNMPEVKLLRRVLAGFDGVGYETVIVTSPDRAQNRRFVQALHKRMLRLFHEPKTQTAAHEVQELRERLGRLLRRLLSFEREPSGETGAVLRAQIEQLHRKPFVAYAYYRNQSRFFESRQLLYLKTKELKTLHDRLRRKLKYEFNRRQPGFIDLLGDGDPGFRYNDIKKNYQKNLDKIVDWIETKDGKLWHNALVVRPLGPSSDFAFTASFLDRLKAEISKLTPSQYHPKMDVLHIGPYSKNLQEYYDASGELTRSFSLTFVLLLLLLLLFFRRVRALVLLFVPLGMGTVWAFGATYLTIGHLNIITGLTGALLLGLGVDYGIYLLDRYWQERRTGCSVEEAIDRCYRSTGVAVATAGMTTAAGFFALLICGFKGFSQFGFISGLGILCCLVSVSAVMPALIVLLDRRWPTTPPNATYQSAVRGAFPWARVLVMVSVLVLIAVPFAIRHVNFEYDIRALSYQKVTFQLHEKRWNTLRDKVLQSTKPVLAILPTRKAVMALTAALEKLAKTQPKADRQRRGEMIQAVYNAHRFVPTAQPQKVQWLQKMRGLIKRYTIKELMEGNTPELKKFRDFRRYLKVRSFTVTDLPFSVQRDLIFYDPDDFRRVKGFLVVVASGLNLFDGLEAQALRDALATVRVAGEKPVFSGEPVTFAVVFEVLRIEGFLAVGVSLLVVALVVLIDLRNGRDTLLALWPLLTGLLGTTLILALFDIRLNFYNLIVLPALLGICVDAGVHLIHRYREQPSLGTLGVQRELALSIALASLTTVISFATTIFAKHLGMKSIGILAVLGLACGLVAALFFLPAMMEVLAKAKPANTTHEE